MSAVTCVILSPACDPNHTSRPKAKNKGPTRACFYVHLRSQQCTARGLPLLVAAARVHLFAAVCKKSESSSRSQCMNLSSSLTAALLPSFQLHCHSNCSDFLIDKCIFMYSLLSLYSFRVSLCAAPSCLCIQVQGTKIASYTHR